MALWILNAGAETDVAQQMLEKGVIGIGWPELPDLASMQDREALLAQYRRCFPQARGARLVQDISQIFAFAHHARRGDLVVLPLRWEMPVAVGEILGDYAYRSDLGGPLLHTRAVRWLDGEMTLGQFEEELRGALDTPLAFCRVQRRGVEEDLRGLLGEGEGGRASSVESVAKDRILSRLEERYAAGRLRDLVTAILELRGLLRRPGGAQSAGPAEELQFVAADDPSVLRMRLAVCTKQEPIEAREIRDFAARVAASGAEQGLFVAWAGLAEDAQRDLSKVSSSVYVWTREDVLEAMLSVYERLPRAVQAEVPLKRIWAPEQP